MNIRSLVLASAVLGAGFSTPLSAQVAHQDSIYDVIIPVVDSVRSWVSEGTVTLLAGYRTGGVPEEILERVAREKSVGLEKEPCYYDGNADCPARATLVWLSSPVPSEDRLVIEVVASGTGLGSPLGASFYHWCYYVVREGARWVVTDVVGLGIGHGLRRGSGGNPPGAGRSCRHPVGGLH